MAGQHLSYKSNSSTIKSLFAPSGWENPPDPLERDLERPETLDSHGWDIPYMVILLTREGGKPQIKDAKIKQVIRESRIR